MSLDQATARLDKLKNVSMALAGANGNLEHAIEELLKAYTLIMQKVDIDELHFSREEKQTINYAPMTAQEAIEVSKKLRQ